MPKKKAKKKNHFLLFNLARCLDEHFFYGGKKIAEKSNLSPYQTTQLIFNPLRNVHFSTHY